MKKVTSSWENLNDLLGINEKNVRSTFIYIIAIFSILISWLLLSDYLFLNYLDKLQDGRMIHMLMNLIFMILLGIISVNLIRNFIKSMNKAKEVNSLLSSVADSANEIVIFAINRDYQFTYFNKMAKEAMLELWNKDIMILTSLLDTIVLKEDREKAQKNFEKVFCGETIKLVEDYGHPDLKRYYWQNYYAPVYDVKHDIIGASIFSINITNLVEAEK
ncbi:MAG: PAS domain-containing protein, partial [Erysipelotrichaceae bacterium]|nr:PAS domain-containing protein [Erysipelotrichaceae bacterium]